MNKKCKIAVLLSLLVLLCLSGCGASGGLQGLFKGKVKLSCGSFPADSERLSVSITAEEIHLLDEFRQLVYVDFTDSGCYREIADWLQSRPELQVSCPLPLPNGGSVEMCSGELLLEGLSSSRLDKALELIGLMPRLCRLELRGGPVDGEALSFQELLSLEKTFPELEIVCDAYPFRVFGGSVLLSGEELDLSGISPEDTELAHELISRMPRLQRVFLGSESGKLRWEDVRDFQLEFPETEFSYEFGLYGRCFNINDGEIDLSYVILEDKAQALCELLPYMPRCTYVDMDSCGLSNEEMAALQAQFPDKKLVWRLFFGTNYTLRTDAERLLASRPSKGGIIDESDLQVLKYCTDLKYLDLGHNGRINDLSFMTTLTKLEVAILGMNTLSDISGIENCVNLEYLELYESNAPTVEPLRNMTKLRHLNIGCTNVTDISPLYELDLERLWIGRYTPVPAEQLAVMQELHPGCWISTEAYDPDDAGWRHIRLAEQDYIIHPRYALLREQFGYSMSDYNFTWNDEEYWSHYGK